MASLRYKEKITKKDEEISQKAETNSRRKSDGG